MLQVLVEGPAEVPILREILVRGFDQTENEGFQVIQHQGRGRPPGNPLRTPAGRTLLDQLGMRLKAAARTGDRVLALIDNDGDDCARRKAWMTDVHARVAALSPAAPPTAKFRVVMQETEAWYLADGQAIRRAFRGADLRRVPQHPEQVSDAAESFARVVGELDTRRKVQWAEAIAPYLNLANPRANSLAAVLDAVSALLA